MEVKLSFDNNIFDPFFKFKAIKAASKACVPFENEITYLEENFFANFLSKSITYLGYLEYLLNNMF